jgi:hypothetical protein
MAFGRAIKLDRATVITIARAPGGVATVLAFDESVLRLWKWPSESVIEFAGQFESRQLCRGRTATCTGGECREQRSSSRRT